MPAAKPYGLPLGKVFCFMTFISRLAAETQATEATNKKSVIIFFILIKYGDSFTNSRQRLWPEVHVAFNEQAQWPAYVLKLFQAEVAKLLLESVNQAEEGVHSVKLGGIPCPVTVWREKLHDDLGIMVAFVGVQLWQVLSNLFC
jgi:hypothetical protein